MTDKAVGIAISMSTAEKDSREMGSNAASNPPQKLGRSPPDPRLELESEGRKKTLSQEHATRAVASTTAQIANTETPHAVIAARKSILQAKPQAKEHANLLGEEAESSDEQSMDETDAYGGMYTLSSKANHPIQLQVTLNGADTIMELDTGASRTIISEATQSEALERESSCPPEVDRQYSDIHRRKTRKITVELVHKRQHGQDITMLIVKGDGPSLIGRDWLGKIRLDWASADTLGVGDTPEAH